MRGRFLVAGGLVLTVGGLAVSAGGASAYLWDHAHADQIAKGVVVGGIDIGGLDAPEAEARLQEQLPERLSRPVQLVYGDHRFTVDPANAGVQVDIPRMVESAVRLSRAGGLAHRLLRDVRGERLNESVPLEAAVSASQIEMFAAHMARVLDRPARNARVMPKPLATGLLIVPSRAGLAVKQPQLERALTAALLRTDDARTVTIPTRAIFPRWWTSTLERRYRTMILVSRETFTLRLYKRLKLVKKYRIAVGRAGLETPAGFYEINDKQVNPSWHVPLSAWAGSLAGQIIPPGPADPIKSRWLGFYNGAGIHGTVETWSLGSAASHGCVRMAIPDVEELYALVPLHTPIYVG